MTKPGRRIRENEAQNTSEGNKWLKWIVEYRFVFIVLAMLVQNLLYVIYTSLGFSGEDFIGSGTLVLMLIFCVLRR